MTTEVSVNGGAEEKPVQEEPIAKNKLNGAESDQGEIKEATTDTQESNGQDNAEDAAKSVVEVTPELLKKIVNQIEYYYGDYNLPRDKFLKEEMKKDDGWVTVETMLNFKRLSNLTTDQTVIIDAIKTSTTDLMEVNEDGPKIRRNPSRPLPLFDDNLKADTAKKTVYLKGFLKDGSCTLDDLLEYFKQYGPYETVHMRHFFSQKDKKQGFKGSILVVFPDIEKAQAFMDLAEVKYKDVVLIRKFYEAYLVEKKAEIDERRATKEARQKEVQDVAMRYDALPEGLFLHMSGVEKEISRELIKAQIAKVSEDLAFIEYNKGDNEGYLRFSKQGANKEVLEKLESKLTVNDCTITLRIVEGDEDKEQLEKANQCRARALSSMSHKRKGGNRGGRGRGNKKRRNYI